jgi:NAD+--dinitrogen-reductase ADP-D-ribosyltransferase
MSALYSTCDNAPGLCRNDDKAPSLPKSARLPINRCNLPAVILGSLTFQRHPTPLVLDGVAELHRELFARLDRLKLAHQRAEVFRDYITVMFRIEHPEEIGLTESVRKSRAKASWMRVIRGWAFDPDGREAAVLKGWVESRFGLTPRHHGAELHDPGDAAYRRYEQMRAEGLYGTNAIEAQLDLVYAYCQYEFARQGTPGHLTLHRGVNRVAAHEMLGAAPSGRRVLLLNNISSFSRERERAGEFGDYILEVAVPTAKVLFHCGLLPGLLQGEGEYLVIGGAYEVGWTTL